MFTGGAGIKENKRLPVEETHRDGVDEGSDSKRQAAADHGEDGVAQVVVDGVGQRALGDVHGGLHDDGGRLPRVLLAR